MVTSSMCALQGEILRYVLDWAFDPDNGQWTETARLQGSCAPELIEFLWSMYVTVKCQGPGCGYKLCLDRARCIFEIVLRQSTTVDLIVPWCSRLTALDVWHETEKTEIKRESLLGLFRNLSGCPSWDRKEFVRAYNALALGGSAAGVCFLARFSNISHEEILQESNTAMTNAAINGHVHVLDCLHKLGLSTQLSGRHALALAAWNCHLDVLDFLHSTFGLTTEDARPALSAAVGSACRYGDVDVLECLHRNWPLSPENARWQNNEALRCAASKGHVDVLDFLHRVLKLNAVDARSNNNEALIKAAGHGHVKALEFLHIVWGLTAEDARSNDNEALTMAARNGHVQVLEFMYNVWGLTAEDARSRHNLAYRKAVKHRRVKVLEFMHRIWGIAA